MFGVSALGDGVLDGGALGCGALSAAARAGAAPALHQPRTCGLPSPPPCACASTPPPPHVCANCRHLPSRTDWNRGLEFDWNWGLELGLELYRQEEAQQVENITFYSICTLVQRYPPYPDSCE